MKKLTRKSLVAVGLMMSLSTLAHDAPVNLVEKETEITNLYFENVKEGSKVSIKDVNGLILYKESIEETGTYSKGFDLTTLPDGTYFFELNTELKIVERPFQVKSNKVIIEKKEEVTIFKSIVRAKDQMVYVSRPVIEKAPLSYKIYYAKNHDLVHASTVHESEEVSKVFDFTKSKPGKYIFVFESKGRTYSKTIEI